MTDRLVHGLLAVKSDLTAEEILDVLWLSATYPIEQIERTDPGDDAAQPAEETSPGADDEPPADTEGLPSYSPNQPKNSEDAGSATAVGFESPRPLRDVVTLPMAVRRLRKVQAPAPRLVVDIDATVEATAEATAETRMRVPTLTRPLLMPNLTRPPQPALDLALVVDESRSMRMWGEVFDDLERLLAQTGAFRSVSRWWLDPVQGMIRPHTRRRQGPYTRRREDERLFQRPQRLVDPSGRRLVLVATDARDRAWYDEPPWDALSTWCAAMPTVLVQVLPAQYWAETAVGALYMSSRAQTPAAPNSQYQRRTAWWTDDPGDPALPVVTLAEKSLDTWAQSVVNGTAWASGITATAPDPDSAPPVGNDVDPEVALNDFLARATPGAQRLARILASAGTQLSMPLIWVLRDRLAPETGVAELAEIRVSGLLEESESPIENEGPLLRFREGTRKILYRGTTAFEEWDALNVVGKYLDERKRSGPLRVYVPDATGSAQYNTNDKPFHDFHHALAVRMGLRPATPNPGTTMPDLAAAVPGVSPGQRGTVREEPGNDRPTSNEASLDALTAELARLDDGQLVTIADFEANGVNVWRVGRDKNGIPQGQRVETFATLPVSDPTTFYMERLAPSLGDSRLIVAVGTLDESQAAVLRILRDTRDAPTFDYREPFDGLLREAIRNTPITRWYDLLVLSEAPDGQLRMVSQPLFRPGATSGDRTEPFTLRCAPTDDRGTVFVVVARNADREPFLPDRLHPAQVKSVSVLPGTYRLTALLSGPGRVQFHGLPAPLLDEHRPLDQLIRQIPLRLRVPAPVHLVCLIEVSGSDARLRRRVDRLTQLVGDADSGKRTLSVSVISYGPHSVERQVKEEPAALETIAASPDRAIRILRRIVGRKAPEHEYERAAQTECALHKLSELLADRRGRDGRPVVVTVGGRPPHPPRVDVRSEIIPCRNRRDWRKVLAQLRQVPAISFGALCDEDAVGEIWRDLGRDAFATLNGEDFIPSFVRDLGLLEVSQVVPFPLLESDMRRQGHRETPIVAEGPPTIPRTFAESRLAISTVAAQLVALGPPGSGKTTFLSALNVALTRQPYGLRLAGTDDAAVDLLISTTEAMVVRHEFPQATASIDYFEWTLYGAASSMPRLTQGGTVESATSAQRPLQMTLGFADPSGEIVARTRTRYPDRQQLIQHVASADSILFMFDPLREFEHRDAFRTMDDFLRRVIWEAGTRGLDDSGKLPHRVAVCVTKFDDARVLDTAVRLDLVTVDPLDPYRFPRVHDNDAREFFVRLSGMHGRSDGERLLGLLDETFHTDRVQFFVTSAVGFYVDPTTNGFDPDDTQNVFTPSNATSTERIRGAIRPINVVEPILWLAGRLAGA